jgi:hypothetical protein
MGEGRVSPSSCSCVVENDAVNGRFTDGQAGNCLRCMQKQARVLVVVETSETCIAFHLYLDSHWQQLIVSQHYHQLMFQATAAMYANGRCLIWLSRWSHPCLLIRGGGKSYLLIRGGSKSGLPSTHSACPPCSSHTLGGARVQSWKCLTSKSHVRV